MHKRIRLDPWTYVFGALLLLTVPVDWLLAAMAAAAIHELCHMAAIRLLGGQILGVCIGIGGTVIDSRIPGKREELVCTLAGPAGSLLLLCLCHSFPKLAICAGIQGLFNLLPVYPLDGGRALTCALELLCPRQADRLLLWAETALYLLLAILGAVGTFLFSLGFFPFFGAVLLIIKAILRKRPCKQREIGVQ